MNVSREEADQFTKARIDNLNQWIEEAKTNIALYECELAWLHALRSGDTKAIDEARIAMDVAKEGQ